MLIGSKAFRNLWEDWQRDYQPLQVLKLLLALAPAMAGSPFAGAKAIVSLYRDARGFIGRA